MENPNSLFYGNMANKLIITLSGKKQAGKNTACNYILAKYLNAYTPEEDKDNAEYSVDSVGNLINIRTNYVYPLVTDQFTHLGVKIYSFADLLKRFCIDVFNVPEECCYGTDIQKSQIISHLLWENFPLIVRFVNGNKTVYCKKLNQTVTANINDEETLFKLMSDDNFEMLDIRSGPMTGREIMQVMGTDVCRKIYGDCWARGTYSTIKREGYSLALICDGRFQNEIELGHEAGAKTIRLSRNVQNDHHNSEIALDKYPIEKYSLYVDNQHLSISEQCAIVSKTVDKWFMETGIEITPDENFVQPLDKENYIDFDNMKVRII